MAAIFALSLVTLPEMCFWRRMKLVWVPPRSDVADRLSLMSPGPAELGSLLWEPGGVTGVKSPPHRHTAHGDAVPELLRIQGSV